jgi:long-chain acyl-CoA synthetase
VLVLEGYGLTETTAATHINRPTHFRFGTVGTPMPGVETKIASDGEVFVRGGNVMKGYFKRPNETADVLDADGWLATGDIGSIDADGFLTITDRKKDVIITAGGKNVAPQNLELALRKSPWISEAVVFGDGKPYLVALVTTEAGTGAEVRGHIADAVAALNRTLEPYQQIRRFAVLERDLSVERDELTASLKVRRRVVAERYAR